MLVINKKLNEYRLEAKFNQEGFIKVYRNSYIKQVMTFKNKHHFLKVIEYLLGDSNVQTNNRI